MNRDFVIYSCIGLVLSCSARIGQATSHVFVRNEQGVWLVSDSYTVHNDINGHSTSYNACKVAISRGQLFFNSGRFRDVKLLIEQESSLPLTSIQTTEATVIRLLTANRMDLSKHPKLLGQPLVVQTGFVQVENGAYRAGMIGETEDLRVGFYPVLLEVGVPYGYGSAVDRISREAKNNPTLAARIARDPKVELLKIINEEAIMRNNEVKEPFTVLLLYPDGTVSDLSDMPLCNIPNDVAHE